jgi:hypothetical protein
MRTIAGRISEAVLSDQGHLLPKLYCQPIQSVEILCPSCHRIKYPPNKSSWASTGSSIGLVFGRREATANGANGVFGYELAQLHNLNSCIFFSSNFPVTPMQFSFH